MRTDYEDFREIATAHISEQARAKTAQNIGSAIIYLLTHLQKYQSIDRMRLYKELCNKWKIETK